jgi:hypothetical protein
MFLAGHPGCHVPLGPVSAELEAKCKAVAASSELYPTRTDLVPGLRAVHGRYLVLYRDLPDENRVRVVCASRHKCPIPSLARSAPSPRPCDEPAREPAPHDRARPIHRRRTRDHARGAAQRLLPDTRSGDHPFGSRLGEPQQRENARKYFAAQRRGAHSPPPSAPAARTSTQKSTGRTPCTSPDRSPATGTGPRSPFRPQAIPHAT